MTKAHTKTTVCINDTYVTCTLPEENTVADIVTHNGRFHCDEVCAIALLLIGELKGKRKVTVVRTRDPRVIEQATYVVDVGKVYDPTTRRFDHHQYNFDIVYPDTSKYASAGLIWLRYGEAIVADIIKTHFPERGDDRALIMSTHEEISAVFKAVDNSDNNYATTDNFNPLLPWLTGLLPVRIPGRPIYEFYCEPFLIALQSCVMWIENRILKSIARSASLDYFLDAIETQSDTEYLVLNSTIPWREYLVEYWDLLSKYKLIITTDEDSSGWTITSLPVSPKRFRTSKCPVPDRLRGLTGSSIATITGIEDVTFCHFGGYLSSTKTMSSAVAFAEYIIAHQ